MSRERKIHRDVTGVEELHSTDADLFTASKPKDSELGDNVELF